MTIPFRAVSPDGILLIDDPLQGDETLGSVILRLRAHLEGREAVVHVGNSVLNVTVDGQITAVPRKRDGRVDDGPRT
jgi:hypothetical protein